MNFLWLSIPSALLVLFSCISVADEVTADLNPSKVDNKEEDKTLSKPSDAVVILPKFSAMRIRLQPKNEDEKKAFEEMRLKRNNALKLAMAVPLTGKGITGKETEKLIEGYNEIMHVCQIGNDAIEDRIKKNTNRSIIINGLLAVLGVGSAAVTGITTAKITGVATAMAGSYKEDLVKDGDVNRSTEKLETIADDVQTEMRQAATEFQRWSYESTDEASRLARMKASLLALNNACSFF